MKPLISQQFASCGRSLGMARRLRGVSLAVVVMAVGAALGAPTAFATSPTFYVNTTKDLPDATLGDGVCADSEGQCTLRAAVEEAGVQPAGSSTTIYVAAGTYKLYRGRLTLEQNTAAINGPGATSTIVSGLGKHEVITTAKGAHLTLFGVTLTAGHGGASRGGALVNYGRTSIQSSVISESTAAQGGGIYNAGSAELNVSSTDVTGNSAAEGVFTGPELEEGGNGGNGGGIANDGSLSVSGGEVSHNSAGTGAHSIANHAGNGGSGGGIWNLGGSANLSNVTITANDAGSGGLGNEEPSGNGGNGGGIYNQAGVVNVSGGSVVTGNAAGGAGLQLNDSSPAQAGSGGGIDNVATLNVTKTLFSANVTGNGPDGGSGAGGAGGAIASSGKLFVGGSTLSANTTGNGAAGSLGGGGGALYNSGSAKLTNNTFSANKTGTGGESSPGGGGAGVWNAGTLNILDTTFTGNVPGPGGNGGVRDPGPGAPGGQGGSGGAILLSAGTLTMTNSTIYDNGVGAGGSGGSPDGVAGGPGVGGGILTTGGSAKLAFVTAASNVVDLTNAGGTLEANGTLIAAASSGPNCSGTITEGNGYNLDSGTSCGFKLSTDLSGVEPKLGPLAANGGATETMALLKGSPAIDKGGNSGTGCPSTDQRGYRRPDESADDGACDIGAYESQKLG
jgi:CSLREA domain-containing protein